MKKIAIIGTGPTGLYTLAGLIQSPMPVSITLYESREVAGVGMPFDEHTNHPVMLANIASIEIPPLACSYLEWLQQQSHSFLKRYGVDKADLNERQFLPRVLLGHYFHNQLQRLIECGRKNGHCISTRVSSTVVDIDAKTSCRLWLKDESEPHGFDYLVIATGHHWPSESKSTPSYFASPWSGLIDSNIPAARIGIMGASLSGIDAAMAVAVQHGRFVEQQGRDANSLRFDLTTSNSDLRITLLSRSGILPEADFYCPIPHEPLTIATPETIRRAIAAPTEGLLDRVFALIVRELKLNDPIWSEKIGLDALDADSFSDAYFSARQEHNPFYWARKNLEEVVENKARRRTVPWRYTLLRLHEAVEPMFPHLDKKDSDRFKQGLKRVFIDNYAAVPPESVRRILALKEAGIIDLVALGDKYDLITHQDYTTIRSEKTNLNFDIFIDARGQKPLKLLDLPFPQLRKQLLQKPHGKPPINDDYIIDLPTIQKGCVALAALPYLMPLKPFVQGITVCAEIGKAVSQNFVGTISQAGRR
ncbi:FAD/NAD(P)-binding protein [Gilvimarinus agarilyticus]|uniref:FAD/NAD(P)-binding protein n=1 Tax=Gilvimarinus agarilyticus TaxID=679259 RepID=UPI00059FBD99|nr:FAD/NAD(P)-binding protein [Gilvimarinus agarilyticus]